MTNTRHPLGHPLESPAGLSYHWGAKCLALLVRYVVKQNLNRAWVSYSEFLLKNWRKSYKTTHTEIWLVSHVNLNYNCLLVTVSYILLWLLQVYHRQVLLSLFSHAYQHHIAPYTYRSGTTVLNTVSLSLSLSISLSHLLFFSLLQTLSPSIFTSTLTTIHLQPGSFPQVRAI